MSEEDHESQRRLSWREATYRFAPLRNALVAAVLTVAGVVADVLGAPGAVSLGFSLMAIPIGGYFFAREGLEELVEEREVGIEILMLFAAAGAMAFGLFEEAGCARCSLRERGGGAPPPAVASPARVR